MTDTSDTPQSSPPLLNKRELAEAMGRSLPTIDAWVRDGCPVAGAGAKGQSYSFDLALVRAWRDGIDSAAAAAEEARLRLIAESQLELTGGSVPEGDSLVLSTRQRMDAANAALLEDRLRKTRAQLLDREAVRADYEAVFQLLRQRLLALPTGLARRFGLTEAQTTDIRADIRALLRDLAHQIADPDLRPAPEPATTAPAA